MLLLNCLKSNLPPRNHTTPQYYTCFGRVHVQTALQLIIIVTFTWDIFRWIDFIVNRGITFAIQLNAFIYAISPLTFTLMLIWVIRVLFACYVYFSDRKKAELNFPIVSIQNNGPSAGITITSPTDPNNVPTTAAAVVVATVASTINSTSPITFSNPNFTLQDENGQK
ncbi:unnamed protein product [Brugia pahangi]|uniref:G_PROTEIN_RECEP_F2_4 domain-containing protein n=1 Tax=Brugia pahangi TaxID=6280 RepID=A0A0N4TZM3_BRUPA|nr:unnamed protein product [Brugia pahangi]